MDVTANKRELDEAFQLTPVEGRPNVYTLRFNLPSHSSIPKGEMTEADWDKFERDIEDAFERVP